MEVLDGAPVSEVAIRYGVSRHSVYVAGLVYIAIGSAEVLPGRPGFAQQLDTGPSQLADGRRQVTHSEPGDRTGTEMLLARITLAEYLDVAAIRELENPEIRLRMHQPEPENVLVEVRQLPAAIGTRAAPAKPCDLHTCQYQHQPGGTASTGIRFEMSASSARKSTREVGILRRNSLAGL